MKLSTRVGYGLRAALVLAEHYGEGPIIGKVVCEEEGLPVAYLEQVMASLCRAGLVISTRGARGGYSLTRPPETISAAELVVALGGPISLCDCGGVAWCTGNHEACVVLDLYHTVEESIRFELASRTLSDLVARRGELKTPKEGEPPLQNGASHSSMP